MWFSLLWNLGHNPKRAIVNCRTFRAQERPTFLTALESLGKYNSFSAYTTLDVSISSLHIILKPLWYLFFKTHFVLPVAVFGYFVIFYWQLKAFPRQINQPMAWLKLDIEELNSQAVLLASLHVFFLLESSFLFVLKVLLVVKLFIILTIQIFFGITIILIIYLIFFFIDVG